MATPELQTKDKIAILERVVQRRRVFRSKFDAETMQLLAEFLGVNNDVFAFRSENGAPIDPYLAAQRDALMGVVRGLQFEIDHLHEVEVELDNLREQEKESSAE